VLAHQNRTPDPAGQATNSVGRQGCHLGRLKGRLASDTRGVHLPHTWRSHRQLCRALWRTLSLSTRAAPQAAPRAARTGRRQCVLQATPLSSAKSVHGGSKAGSLLVYWRAKRRWHTSTTLCLRRSPTYVAWHAAACLRTGGVGRCSRPDMATRWNTGRSGRSGSDVSDPTPLRA